MQKEMARMARLDKQGEYVVRWDDFGIGFGGKSKAKGKEKEKDRGRSGKDRDEKLQKPKQGVPTGSDSLICEGGTDKDKDHNRERQHEKDRQRGNLHYHHRERFFHPDDRYIPASREEAIAKGMLIVCAKFRISNADDIGKARKKRHKSHLSLLRDIGLDASIAGSGGEEFGSGDGWMQNDQWVEKNAGWRRSQISGSSPATISLPPPRKASLPGLGLTMLRSGGNITPSGSIFGGFFGKDSANLDKQDGSDAKKGHGMSKQHGLGGTFGYPSSGLPILTRKTDEGPVGHSKKAPEAKDQKKLDLPFNTVRNAAARSSPNVYTNDRELDEGPDIGQGGYRTEYEDDGYAEQATREAKMSPKEERAERVVLDMGTEIGKSTSNMKSSFIDMIQSLQ
jgi:hypothetical protein